MVHEEAADQVMLVANSHWHNPIGGEQQTRVFDAAAGKDVVLGPCANVPAIKGAHSKSRDVGGVLVRFDFGDVGIAVHVDICRAGKLVAIYGAEVARMTEL